jgi:hypothetical protein
VYIYKKAKNDLRFSEEIKQLLKLMENSEKILREVISYKAIKRLEKLLQKLSKENNTNIKFGELLKNII